jgi:SPOR domain
MMRALFWLVLLANLLFFAYVQWGGALTGAEADLQLQPPLNPGKIRLLSAPVAASPAVAPPSHPGPSAGRPASIAQAAPATAPAACMEWGEFSGNDLARATTALAAMKLGNQLAQHEVEHNTGYWVYIPPQHNHAGVGKKVAELKALGVKDYFIVQDAGKWQNAISLGIFRTQEAAQNYLDGLQKKGVKSALVGERQAKLKFAVFLFRNPDSALTARVVALQKGFPGSELKAAACN